MLAGSGALAQDASELTDLELLSCVFPDTCYQDQCLTADRPLQVVFATLGADDLRVVALLPDEAGAVPAVSADMGETRRMMFMRTPDVMPIRSLSISADGRSLISLWMDSGTGSVTQSGTCEVVPPNSDGAS